MSKMFEFHKSSIEVPGSSRFNLSSENKFTTQFGWLVPVQWKEVYPGENFRINTEQFLRMQPLLAPVMHSAAIDVNHFFVPFRLLWDLFPRWISGDVDDEHPYVVGLNTYQNGKLADYLGYNYGGNASANIKCSAFPIAAYLSIFDEWYRDQNLVDDQLPTGGLVPGDNTANLAGFLANNPLSGALQHDYFTSCIPFPTKGGGGNVRIPVFVSGDGIVEYAEDLMTPGLWRDVTDDSLPTSAAGVRFDSLGQTELGNPGPEGFYDPNGTLIIPNDMIGSIRDLRLASVLYEWYEKQARAGSRYNETVLSNFATYTGDARIDRPEHLGGYTQKIRFSEVLGTANDAANSIPVGYLAGHAASYGDSRVFSYDAKEHGILMSIARVRPKTSYSQGINRCLLRSDRFDYMWPTFANVGDQEVTKKEVWLGREVDGTDSGLGADVLDKTFGYQERYAELKVGFDTVHGNFKDVSRFWDMSRGFDNEPALNWDFIRADQLDFNRIFAVPGAGHPILVQMHINCLAMRPLPVYSDPNL
jgi:hypothetical protein